jgi:cytochrome b561
MLKNTEKNYGLITRILHALMAIFVIGMLTIGLLLSKFKDAELYNLHKLTGLFVLVLSMSFILWIFANKKVAYPTNMQKWECILAKSIQHMLLLFVVFMALSGWIFSSAAQKAPQLFNMYLGIPYMSHNPHLIIIFKKIHKLLVWGIIGLLSIHSLAAIKHLVIDKDSIFERMFWKT